MQIGQSRKAIGHGQQALTHVFIPCQTDKWFLIDVTARDKNGSPIAPLLDSLPSPPRSCGEVRLPREEEALETSLPRQVCPEQFYDVPVAPRSLSAAGVGLPAALGVWTADGIR